MHPVDGDLIVTFRGPSRQEGGVVQCRVRGKHPDGGVLLPVATPVLRLVVVEALIQRHRHRGEVAVQAVPLRDLVPFLVHRLYDGLVCLVVGFRRRLLVCLRLPGLRQGVVKTALYDSVHLGGHHRLIGDAHRGALGAHRLFDFAPDGIAQLGFDGLRHLLVRLRRGLVDIVLPHVGPLPALDGGQQFGGCFVLQFKRAVLQRQGLSPVGHRRQHAVVAHVHAGDNADHHHHEQDDHQIFVPLRGQLLGNPLHQRVFHAVAPLTIPVPPPSAWSDSWCCGAPRRPAAGSRDPPFG